MAIVIILLSLSCAVLVLSCLIWKLIIAKKAKEMKRLFFNDSEQKERGVHKYRYNRIVDLKSTPNQPWSPTEIHDTDELGELQATTALNPPRKDKTDGYSSEQQKKGFLNSKEVAGDKLLQQINHMKQTGQRNVHDNKGRYSINNYDKLNRAISSLKTDGRQKLHFTGEFNKNNSITNALRNASKTNDFPHKIRKGRKKKRKYQTGKSSSEENDLTHLIPTKQQRYEWYRAGPVNYLIGSSKINLENKPRKKVHRGREDEGDDKEFFQKNDFTNECQHEGKLKGLRELTKKKQRNRKTRSRRKKDDRRRGTSENNLRISEPIVLRTDTEEIKNFFNRGFKTKSVKERTKEL